MIKHRYEYNSKIKSNAASSIIAEPTSTVPRNIYKNMFKLNEKLEENNSDSDGCWS